MGEIYHNLSTFEEAVKVHDSIIPVRGRTVRTARPLDNGGSRYKSCVFIYQPNDDEVQVHHYSTPIATFYRDGRIRASTLQFATTRGYVGSMLRPHVRVYRQHNEEVLDHKSGWFKLHSGGDFTLLPDGSVDLDSVAPAFHYSVDRKEANAIRKNSVFAEEWKRFFTKLRVQGIRELFAARRAEGTSAHPHYHMQRVFRGDAALKDALEDIFCWEALSANIHHSTVESFMEWMHPYYWYPVYKHVDAYRKQELGRGPFNSATLSAALRSTQAYNNLPNV